MGLRDMRGGPPNLIVVKGNLLRGTYNARGCRSFGLRDNNMSPRD